LPDQNRGIGKKEKADKTETGRREGSLETLRGNGKERKASQNPTEKEKTPKRWRQLKSCLHTDRAGCQVSTKNN